MKKLNKTTDLEKYLKNGELTIPFLNKEHLEQEVKNISKQRNEKNLNASIEYCLFDFIHKNLKYGKDKDFIIKNQFSRSAKEIFESKIATGCTDYAYVFACFARQMGIPTTILQTAQEEWTNRLINNIGDTKLHYGHTFCECFIHDKWVLIDPTKKEIDFEYQNSPTSKIELKWKVGNSKTFLPYYRGLDLGAPMTLAEFLEKENKIVKQKFSRIYKISKVKLN